ncbi:unnamed protein product [Lota lota]
MWLSLNPNNGRADFPFTAGVQICRAASPHRLHAELCLERMRQVTGPRASTQQSDDKYSQPSAAHKLTAGPAQNTEGLVVA